MIDKEKRYGDCYALEMCFDGDSFIGKFDYNRDFNIHWTEISCDTEEQWETKIKTMTTELENRKQNKDESNNTRTHAGQ